MRRNEWECRKADEHHTPREQGSAVEDESEPINVRERLYHGKVFRPEDELRGMRLDVRLAEPQKAGTHRVVQEWNEAVRQTLDEQTADVAGPG